MLHRLWLWLFGRRAKWVFERVDEKEDGIEINRVVIRVWNPDASHHEAMTEQIRELTAQGWRLIYAPRRPGENDHA